MIQYYLDLAEQIKRINDIRLSHGQIQKIYSTSQFISLAVRAPGKTWHLYLGRGSGYEGVWLHESPPISALRRRDNFLEYLRRYLSSCSFLGISLDTDDRIVRLDYQKYGQKQSILFFWKARKLYFLHYFQESPEAPFKLLLSWKGKAFIPATDMQDLFEYFDEVGRRGDMQHDLRSSQQYTIGDLLDEEMKAANLKTINSSPNFLQRKLKNIEEDLGRARQWEQIQNVLDEGQALDDYYEMKIGDHKIKFEGELNPYERRNLLFQKIKKLKRGEGILAQRLAHVQEELEGKPKEVKSHSALPMVKPVWGKEAVSTGMPASEQEREDFKLYKFEDCTIGVGLSSQGNDQLRSKWAKKDDLWLHLDGLKSAHAIIKLHQQKSITADMINTAATLLAHHSHFQDDWIPIIYTQVKNLKGVTGAAGMVIYKKEKHLKCPRVNLDE